MSSVTMPMPLEMKMMEDASVILALNRLFWIRDVRRCDLLAQSVVCLSEDSVMQAIEQAFLELLSLMS